MTGTCWVLLCLFLCLAKQTLSFDFDVPPKSVFTDGFMKINSDKEERIQLQRKQDKIEGELADVNNTISSVMEKMKVLETERASESKSLKQLKEQMETIVSEQSDLKPKLSTLTHNVSKVEDNRKAVESVKTDVADVKRASADTDGRVSDFSNTLEKVERSLSKLRTGATTCAEVQKCGKVETDGEFWLYPNMLDDRKVKIFCSGMNTSEPEEFVSLSNPNEGDYPNVHNAGCRGESDKNHPKKSLIGHVSFNKIRVNITTLEVMSSDRTYAEKTGNAPRYGHARDCYSSVYGSNKCGPKGYFNIDTRGTGLRVKKELIWVKEGNNGAVIEEREADGQVVNLRCGGYCGGCHPKGPIIMEPSPNEVLPDSEATHVKCPLYQP